MTNDEKAAVMRALNERAFTNIAEAMKGMKVEREDLELLRDNARRALSKLIRREHFGVARQVMKEAQEEMSEAIEYLEQQQEDGEQMPLRGYPHRHSA